MTATIHHSDCIDALRNMPDNSVDAIACDPPYGLSNTGPDKVTETITRWAQGDREYVPQGKGFMGASWDAFVPPVAVWDECLRVLKPGGHLVAFAGSRTQDLMGLAIRLAGFDIRENLAWLYGSGFPKSLDVSKAIDKARDDYPAIREVVMYIREAFAASGAARADLDEALCGKSVMDHFLKPSRGNAHCPTWAQWGILKGLLHFDGSMDAEVWRLNGRKGTPGENWDFRPITQEGKGEHRPGEVIAFDQRSSSDRERRDIAATMEAEKWQGWGTALKPGHEPIILARKPIQGTVAANTLTWGTGGLNIDATRIGTQPAGRWPANVVLDPDTAKALDQQSGTSKSTQATFPSGGTFLLGGYASLKDLRAGAERDEVTPDGRNRAKATLDRYIAKGGNEGGYNDEGGASRFFKVAEPDVPFMYAAKAPKRERPSYTTEDGQTVQHATVKPLSIMQWLVKLVTPDGGTVLDPFAGSGTTVEAAILEGFNVIGIEREAEYLPLIQQRIDRASNVLPMAS